jgi:hypothetical protein
MQASTLRQSMLSAVILAQVSSLSTPK